MRRNEDFEYKISLLVLSNYPRSSVSFWFFRRVLDKHDVGKIDRKISVLEGDDFFENSHLNLMKGESRIHKVS